MRKAAQPLQLSSINTERFDDCKHYNSCLAIAASCHWPSFSCFGCKLYLPTTRFQPDRLSRIATPLADTFN